jgi:hypothetical protein
VPAVVVAAVVLLVALLGGCAATKSTAEQPTRLTIRAWPQGRPKPPVRTWTLTCPAGGTLPRPERACARLDGSPPPFAPLPDRKACTQIYGGPAEATVTGTFHGDRVSVAFSRTDGCQIARWNRVVVLFPGVATG